MKNLMTVLKKLGKKLTGQDITGTNLVNVIDNIADNYEGGGSSGGGELVVNVVRQTSANEKLLDKNLSEIMQFIASGSYNVVIVDGSGGGAIYRLFFSYGDTSNGGVAFYTITAYKSGDTQSFSVTRFSIASSKPDTAVFETVSF
jgi:hypothetical protein